MFFRQVYFTLLPLVSVVVGGDLKLDRCSIGQTSDSVIGSTTLARKYDWPKTYSRYNPNTNP